MVFVTLLPNTRQNTGLRGGWGEWPRRTADEACLAPTKRMSREWRECSLWLTYTCISEAHDQVHTRWIVCTQSIIYIHIIYKTCTSRHVYVHYGHTHAV